MIGCRIVLAGVLAMLTCFGRGAEPLKIGMVAPVTGPLAETGRYQIQGAKLAVEEINKAGGLLGRQIELVIEDDQTTNPGVVLAFSKLAGDKDIPGFIGPTLSTQIHAIAPDIQRLGKPVMIGGSDPRLTHMGNPWLFRCRPNDIYSARVIADYGVNTLGKKKWAIVHSTDAFGTNGMKNLVEDLKRTGVEPVLIQGYTNNSQDFTPVALAVKQSGADVMGTYMTFPTDLGIFARVVFYASLAHLVEIALWAVLFMICGEFTDFGTAFYHSAVNYTSLGYGDFIMTPSWRLLGPLETANGTLLFGVSTAMIFGVMLWLIQTRFTDLKA